MKKAVFIFVLIFTLYSCDKPCEEGATGPPNFNVEIVNKVTNENVFANGAYLPSQLRVLTPGSSTFTYSFISENNKNLINISPAYVDGSFTTNIILNNQKTIPIKTKIYKTSTKCFENFFIEKVEVVGYDYLYDEQTGIYTIKI